MLYPSITLSSQEVVHSNTGLCDSCCCIRASLSVRKRLCTAIQACVTAVVVYRHHSQFAKRGCARQYRLVRQLLLYTGITLSSQEVVHSNAGSCDSCCCIRASLSVRKKLCTAMQACVTAVVVYRHHSQFAKRGCAQQYRLVRQLLLYTGITLSSQQEVVHSNTGSCDSCCCIRASLSVRKKLCTAIQACVTAVAVSGQSFISCPRTAKRFTRIPKQFIETRRARLNF